jgi:DNA polymerase III alpha subunit (gram-positive type)
VDDVEVVVKKWMEMPLIGIDTETTGLLVQEDRIFELGMVTFENGVITDSFCEFIDPMQTLSDVIVQKTGVDNSQVSGKPIFAHYANELVTRVKGQVLVGYNLLEFDLPLIQAELARVGLTMPECWAVDALILARGVVKGGRHTLSDMAVHFGVPMETAHRANADAEATVRILMAMAPELPENLEELLALQHHWWGEQRAKRAMWRNRDDSSRDIGLLGGNVMIGSKIIDDSGRIILGPGYLYGQQKDPLRAFVGALCNQAVESNKGL